MTRGLLLLVISMLTAHLAHASNTATSRSFTSEWECENGRTLQFNAHPKRPSKHAWVIYAGRRIEVRVQKTAPGEPARFASKDGKVVWVRLQDSSMLQMEELLEQPLNCTLKSNTQPNK